MEASGRRSPLPAVVAALTVLSAAAAVGVPRMLAASRAANEAAAVVSLRRLVRAEASVPYRQDLAALADRLPPDLSLGSASGYRFGAILLDEAGAPLDPARRFAYYAIPETYGDTGRTTFLAGEDGKVYAKDPGLNVLPARWPAADPAAAGWRIIP